VSIWVMNGVGFGGVPSLNSNSFYRWLLFIMTEKHTLPTVVMWLPNWFDRNKMVSSSGSLGLTGMYTQVHREIPAKLPHFAVLMTDASSTNPLYVSVWKDPCRITITNGKGQTGLGGVYGGHRWIATMDMDL